MRKPLKAIFWFLFSGWIFLSSCSASSVEEESPVQSNRIIDFSGIEWVVRESQETKAGPGPNFFSSSEKSVWVDEEGRLHLKIRQEGGNWYCSGVTARRSFGYGTYTFYLNTDITFLDEHVVVGLFTYLNDNEEIDIELSRWSDPERSNAQFAVQPSDIEGNKIRFDIKEGTKQTLHSFYWQKDKIEFNSVGKAEGHGWEPIYDWVYLGRSVPIESHERLKMNLWLNRGEIPASGKEQEIVVDSVVYRPDSIF